MILICVVVYTILTFYFYDTEVYFRHGIYNLMKTNWGFRKIIWKNYYQLVFAYYLCLAYHLIPFRNAKKKVGAQNSINERFDKKKIFNQNESKRSKYYIKYIFLSKILNQIKVWWTISYIINVSIYWLIKNILKTFFTVHFKTINSFFEATP